MNEIITKLNEWGCDTKGAMSRFLDNESMYISFLYRISQDSLFEDLGKAIKDNNKETAFEHAHALKGVLGNMGLTPMYDIVSIISDTYKKKIDSDMSSIYDNLMKEKEVLDKILN